MISFVLKTPSDATFSEGSTGHFFIFMQFLAKIIPNDRLVSRGLAPPLEILNPPLTLYYDLMMLFDSRGMLPRHRLLHFKNYSINDSFQIHIVYYFTAMHESPSKHPQKQSQQVDLLIR